MRQPTYDINIPASVRFDTELCLAARMLYGEINALCDERGYCWASNQYFAQLYQVKRKAVSRWIQQLEERHYVRIEIDPTQGNLRQIYPTTYPSKKDGLSSEKETGQPLSEKGYPPEKTAVANPLLIDKNIDNIDRVYTMSSQKGIVNSEDREEVFSREREASQDGSVSAPHPPVAPYPLPPRKPKAFAKPSVKEAEEYMLSQKELCANAITARAQALRFVNYYESNGWKVGRNAMKDWRAAANNWLLNTEAYQSTKQTANNHLHSGGKKDYSIPL